MAGGPELPVGQARRRRPHVLPAATGWGLALLLHGGLLAALILEQPLQLRPVAATPAISLLLQRPSGQTQRPVQVRPKPPALPAQLPAAPAKIANAMAARPAPVFKSPPAAVTPPAAAAIAAPAPAPQGFAAAAPLPGTVNQPPEYPQAAVAHGEQGRVLLSIHVLPDGRTDFVSVTQSSGYRILDQAAQEAVLKWRFQPATLAGVAVVQVIPYWINFDLQTQAARPPEARPAQ